MTHALAGALKKYSRKKPKHKHGNNFYDWIAFFDFDEYIFLLNNSNIKNYLSDDKFSKCESILLNWRIFGDNNLLRYDNRTMIERFAFTRLSSLTKFIVRGNLTELLITSAHIAINTNYCNSKGEFIYPSSYRDLKIENNSIAYIRHYYTKTSEEFCTKISRGDVQFNNPIPINKIKLFFSINNKTLEKIKIFEKYFNFKSNITNILS